MSEYLRVDTNINRKVVEYVQDAVKPFQIVKAELLDSSGLQLNKSVDVNDKLFLKVNYLFNKDIPMMHLTLIISNDIGEVVSFFDRTDYSMNYFSVKKGNYQTILEIPNPFLKPGSYTITLGCSDNESNINDHKFDVLSFEIENITAMRTIRNGYTFFPIKWDMDAL